MHGTIEMAKQKKPSRLRVVSKADVGRVDDRRATDRLRNAIVGPIVVDDPYAGDRGEKIVVIRSLRDDPLAAMHDRKQIDEAQYQAGRHWQRAYELSELGGARAIDPTKEAVDGGRFPDALSDRAANAFSDLRKAARALGVEGGLIIQDILGSGMTILHCAAKRGATTEPELKYIGRRFREALETLAVVFGYVTRARP